jgi:hypothetical protein
MTQLRAAGKTYQEIADHLNLHSIPTKSRKAHWKRTTVWKILKAANQ